MSLPEGYSTATPGQVCLLRRSLYSLKQASRQWNVELSSRLLDFGFRQSYFDPRLFLKSTGTSFLALLIYIDDVLIPGSHESAILEAKDFLHSRFTIKDMGYAKYFLGQESARHSRGTCTYIHQSKYILDLLLDVGLLGAKPAITPLPPLTKGHQFVADSGPPLADPAPFRRLIGRLLYLNFTCHDIS